MAFFSKKHSSESRDGRGVLPRALARVCLCALVASSLALVTSCRDSDALKEIIYDQSSDNIDYANPNKYYINDSTAEQESSAVSSMEVSTEEPTSDIIQNLIIYSSSPNSEGYVAKKSKFSTTPDFSGIEASETVFFYKSDSVDAIEHSVTAADEQEEEEQNDDTSSETSDGTNSDDTATKNKVVGNAGTGGTVAGPLVEDSTGGGPGNTGEEVPGNYNPTDGFSENEQTGSTHTPSVAFDGNKMQDPEKVPISSCAAFGQYAVMVQMLGGEGALVATDYATLTGFHNAGIAGSGDIANNVVDEIALGWRDDGSTARYLDAQAIINAFKIKDPEGLKNGTCYMIVDSAETYFANYGTVQQQLEDAGIKFINLRSMANSEYIKSNVSDLGTMLKQSSVAQYGAQADASSNSKARATYYKNFHDEKVLAANGGLGAIQTEYSDDTASGTRMTGVLQTGSDSIGYSSNDRTVYTLLVDYWDGGAQFVGKPFAAGVAFSEAGYNTTPVSYYMQAGGVINNAAVITTKTSSGKVPALQFAQSVLPSTSSLSLTTSLDLYESATAMRGLLDTGMNINSVNVGTGLGSSDMPKLVVTDSAVKKRIIDSSRIVGSLYHPYDYISNGFVHAPAYSSSSGVYWSSIGNDNVSMTVENPTNPLGSSIPDDVIVVNPKGYFCDWTKGTVESFLEAGWISSTFYTDRYSSLQWEKDVKDFYSWAYNVDININSIKNQ